MINTSFNLSTLNTRQLTACSGGCQDTSDLPKDGFAASSAPTEPVFHGINPGINPPAPPSEGGPVWSGPCFPTGPIDVPATFEPWLMGEPTTNSGVSGQYADKLTRAFGESAVLDIKDERLGGVEGYLYGGLETVGGDTDWLSGVTCMRLGAGWETSEFGKYELKGNGVSQTLSLAPDGSRTLESTYVDNTYDTSIRTETLTLDRDGNMRRSQNTPGL